MDYEETFSPMIHTLIVVAYSFQWKIFKMDVQTTFLNEYLQEEVYMTLPPGVSYNLVKFANFKTSFYDLKQAYHARFEKFS